MRTAAGRCQALQHSCGLLLTSLAACLANAACLPPVCSGECEVQVPDCALRQGHRGVLRLGRARVATHRQHCSTPRRASPARAPAADAVRPLFRCVHGPADCISCRLVASASRRPLEARALRQPATKARGQQHRQASTCLQPLGSVAAGRSRPWPGQWALSLVADAAAPGAAPLPRARGAPLLCAGRLLPAHRAMGLPEAPPPGEELFAPGSNLLVRAPLATLHTVLRPDADGFGTLSTAPGGLGDTIDFETDLFYGKMKVRGHTAARSLQLNLAGRRTLPCASPRQPHPAPRARARRSCSACLPSSRTPRSASCSPARSARCVSGARRRA